jgi:hypothetical protein
MKRVDLTAYHTWQVKPLGLSYAHYLSGRWWRRHVKLATGKHLFLGTAGRWPFTMETIDALKSMRSHCAWHFFVATGLWPHIRVVKLYSGQASSGCAMDECTFLRLYEQSIHISLWWKIYFHMKSLLRHCTLNIRSRMWSAGTWEVFPILITYGYRYTVQNCTGGNTYSALPQHFIGFHRILT